MNEADIFPITPDHENCIEEKEWAEYAMQIEHGQMTAEEAEIKFSAWRSARLQQLGSDVLKAS